MVKHDSKSATVEHKLIGEILQEAGLISEAQLEVALQDQTQFFKLKLGEILAMRGWVKKETVDFFAEKWESITEECCYQHHRIGQYFKGANLLNEQQIQAIIKEQKQTGLKFCEVAILKGFIKEKTANFFLENLCFQCEQKISNSSYFDQQIVGHKDKNTLSQKNKQTSTTITTAKTITVSGNQAQAIYCGDFAYSPISIDF